MRSVIVSIVCLVEQPCDDAAGGPCVSCCLPRRRLHVSTRYEALTLRSSSTKLSYRKLGGKPAIAKQARTTKEPIAFPTAATRSGTRSIPARPWTPVPHRERFAFHGLQLLHPSCSSPIVVVRSAASAITAVDHQRLRELFSAYCLALVFKLLQPVIVHVQSRRLMASIIVRNPGSAASSWS